MQIARASVFASLADGVAAETVTGVYRELVATRPGALQRVSRDDDVPRRRHAARLPRRGAAARRTGANAIESGAACAADAHLTRTVVWPGARVGHGVRLEDCIVTTGAHVPKDFRCAGAVLLPASVARDGETRQGGTIVAVPIV